MTAVAPLVGGIEAGGTKFVCAVGRGPGDIVARQRIETSSEPMRTVEACVRWFRAQGAIAALGIGSFGPVDLAARRITTTPKVGWAQFPLGDAFADALGVPIGFDTDVNAAALAEQRWGAGRGCDPLVYITIGTGIGAGVQVHGELLHGALHPEMGHIRLARAPGDDFAGVCPAHGACWEGLCSGPAMRARTGQAAEALPPEHPAWALEAHYIAQALHTMLCVLSPSRIVVGGSVAKGGQLGQAALFQRIYRALERSVNGYLAIPQLADLATYIVPPGLGDDAGVLGSFALAHRAL